MSRRAIIVHCWDGVPNYCWYPQVKKELENNSFKVDIPEFPETAKPNLEKWLAKLNEVIGDSNENLFLVGHSVGCITILRYLESLDSIQKIGGVVLVAGFTDDLGYNELKNFFEKSINFEKIKKHCHQFVAIHSDDDPYVDLKYANIFKLNLDAKVIIKHHAGHFSGAVDDEVACVNLPEVTESILKMIN